MTPNSQAFCENSTGLHRGNLGWSVLPNATGLQTLTSAPCVCFHLVNQKTELKEGQKIGRDRRRKGGREEERKEEGSRRKRAKGKENKEKSLTLSK